MLFQNLISSLRMFKETTFDKEQCQPKELAVFHWNRGCDKNLAKFFYITFVKVISKTKKVSELPDY